MQVNSCVLKHLFLEGVQQPKKIAFKTPEMLSPTRYQYRVFKISWLTLRKTYIYMSLLENKRTTKKELSLPGRKPGGCVYGHLVRGQWFEKKCLYRLISLLLCVAVCCSALQCIAAHKTYCIVTLGCSVLQCFAVCCSRVYRFPGLVCRG